MGASLFFPKRFFLTKRIQKGLILEGINRKRRRKRRGRKKEKERKEREKEEREGRKEIRWVVLLDGT